MKTKRRPPALRELTSVGVLLETPAVRRLAQQHGRELVRAAIRGVLEDERRAILAGGTAPGRTALLERIAREVPRLARGSLRPVVNATGVVLHTNLGRAPLGREVLEAIAEAAGGYCNLEFDLATGRRGERSAHARELLRLLTGAEDALVVNNNAAALLLALSVHAAGREVVVSRGELIEIGGAFRLPEVMAASGARMVEVGTTNRTRLSDYERALGPDTALIFKAHRSNYAIVGFTEEASVRELSGLARAHGLPLLYDVGSGLLRRRPGSALEREPDVQGALADGADLVSFSGDKLLGGPQAGILVGRTACIEPCARAPLMRALRVDKLTYAGLLAAGRTYLDPAGPSEAQCPIFAFLARDRRTLDGLAERLGRRLAEAGVVARVVASTGRCGGGALPGVELPSAGVEVPAGSRPDDRNGFAERLHRALLDGDPPVLAVLREGRLILDVLALFEEQLPVVAAAVARACESLGRP
ncbi:MAG: L-seryl-tRNA(Sec) selenium transferase [Deltaproteobacteria bacterium]|nr:L-seryl-tRNA(Sec) selenium transferase [Deltaproteobacteria bacterium]